MPNFSISEQELDTILAALRHWQQDRSRVEALGNDDLGADTQECAQWEMANEHGAAISLEDIDELCRHLNEG